MLSKKKKKKEVILKYLIEKKNPYIILKTFLLHAYASSIPLDILLQSMVYVTQW